LDGTAKWHDTQLLEKIQQHLEGKRFLIVLDDLRDGPLYDGVKSAFLNTNCSPILVTTGSLVVATHLSPDEIEMYRVESIYPGLYDYLTYFYLGKVISLLNNNHKITYLEPVLRAILAKLVYQTHNCKLFLYALYVNPSRALEDFQSLQDSLVSLPSLNEGQIIRFAYNSLSSNCKNCLRYLIIFPQEYHF
jgi:hypothetical protein